MPDLERDGFNDFRVSPKYTGEIPKILLYLARLEKGDLQSNIMKNTGLDKSSFKSGINYLRNIKAIDYGPVFSEEGGKKTFEMRYTITKLGIEKLQSYKT